VLLSLGVILPFESPATGEDKKNDPLLEPPSTVVAPFQPLAEFAKTHNIALSRIEVGEKHSQL